MEYLLRNFDSFFSLKVPVVLVASSTLKTKKSRKRTGSSGTSRKLFSEISEDGIMIVDTTKDNRPHSVYSDDDSKTGQNMDQSQSLRLRSSRFLQVIIYLLCSDPGYLLVCEFNDVNLVLPSKASRLVVLQSYSSYSFHTKIFVRFPVLSMNIIIFAPCIVESTNVPC